VFLLVIICIGLMAGLFANVVLGGTSHPKSWGELAIAGFAGSFVGGLIGNLIAGNGLKLRPSGLIGSAIGAVIVLFVMRKVRGRSAAKAKAAAKATHTPNSKSGIHAKPKPKAKRR
jgi:uncharacterized membrane protein YeaQ/YmgE (transglycosylase-associated protein family)